MAVTFNWHNEQNNVLSGPAASLNVGATAPAGSNGTFTLGDILVCVVWVFSSTLSADPIVPAAGWNIIGTQQNTAGGNTLAFYYKIATGSESGSYTFSWTNSKFFAWALLDYGGASSTPDANSTAGLYATGGTANAVATSISVSGSNDTLVTIWFSDNSQTMAAPAGSNQRVTTTMENTTPWYLAADLVLVSSGPTGNQTATQTVGFNTGAWMMLALAPAGVTGINIWPYKV